MAAHVPLYTHAASLVHLYSSMFVRSCSNSLLLSAAQWISFVVSSRRERLIQSFLRLLQVFNKLMIDTEDLSVKFEKQMEKTVESVGSFGSGDRTCYAQITALCIGEFP